MKLVKWMLLAALAAGTAGSAFALGGSGSPDDPYTIGSYADLLEFAQVVDGTHAALAQNRSAWAVVTNDIAATEADWVPIGRFGYKGTFDGAGHTISGLANAGTPDWAGMFDDVAGAGVVRNVRLAGVAFNAGTAGGVAAINSGTVSNCCVSGTVRGEPCAGGVVGYNYGTVANCYNTGAVSVGDNAYAGGVAGNNQGTVQNCHSTGAVSGGGGRGGIVGFNDGGTVSHCYWPVSLSVEAVGNDGDMSGTVEKSWPLGPEVYTNECFFEDWDFTNVWAMGSEGPYLRVLGERVEYPVWVDGVQVTDVNSGDILGNGTARFAGTMSWGTLMLTNAVITNAVKYTSGSEATAGIYAGNGFDLTISLEGSNRVENATEYGVGNGILAEGNLSLGGTGSLTAEAGSSAHGIYANGNLRIEDATVAASGLYGLCSRKNIVFTNTTVTATGAFDAISAIGSATFAGESRVEATATWSGQDGVFAEGGITVGEELHLVEPDGGGLEGGRRYFVDAGGNAVQHVLLEPSVAYPLWVGSTQVTSANAANILGDGTARFESSASGGTLYLSNARITEAIEYSGTDTAGIYSGEGFDLTISLAGSNRVESAESTSDNFCVYARSNLAITGEGTLVAEMTGENGWGIGAYDNLRIDGATVTVSAGDTGLSFRNTLAISNATVTATGTSSYGIYCSGTNGRIDIADSVVTATGGTKGLYARGTGSSLAVSGASVVTAVTTSDDNVAFSAAALVLGDGLAVTEPAGGVFGEDEQTVVDPATGAPAKRVVIAVPPPVPPSVSNVVARQRWPWNGLVDVDYEVGGYTTGLTARITFEERIEGGTGRIWVASNFLAGAEPSVEPGLHRATWDTAADGVTGVVAAVKATVNLVGTGNEKGLELVSKIVIVTPVDPDSDPSCVEVNGNGYLLTNDPKGIPIDLRFGSGRDSAKLGDVVGITLDPEKAKKYFESAESLQLVPSEGIKLVDPTTGDKVGGLEVNPDGSVTFFVTADQVVPGGSITVHGNGKTVVIDNINFYDSVPEGWVGVVVTSAASAEFRLDTREGPFESDGTETLTYSSIWHGDTNATVTILQNGDEDEPVADELAGEGDVVWQVFEDGTYVLVHKTMAGDATVSAEETATFVVPDRPPVVSNVVARQRWPWNGLVDVDYTVGGYTTGMVARISFAAPDGRTWTASTFLDGAEPSAEPGFHRATWDTAADGATNVVAESVTAKVELVRPPAP